MADPEKPTEIEPEAARQGRNSARMIVVLAASLALALLAMAIVLGYFQPQFEVLGF